MPLLWFEPQGQNITAESRGIINKRMDLFDNRRLFQMGVAARATAPLNRGSEKARGDTNPLYLKLK